MLPSDDFRSRALAAAQRAPLVTRRAVRFRNTALFVSGFMVPVGLFLVSGGARPGGRPDVLMTETAVGAAAIALTMLVLATARGRSTLGRSGSLLFALAILAPVAMFAWKYLVSSRFPGMTDAAPDRPGFRCLELSGLLSAWPLVALVMTRRGTDPVHPHLTGAAIGAAVGACAWVFVDLWCAVAYVPHLLLGHVLPLVACTLVGAALGEVIALRGR